MKSLTSKVPECSFFLTSLQRYSRGQNGGKKMKKKKSLQQNPLFLQIYFSVFGSRVCILGVGDIWSDKYISLYNFAPFCTQGAFSTCVPDCSSFKINLQFKELTLRAGRMVGNVQMQVWKCLEELLQGPEGSSKAFCCQEEISVWIFIWTM